MEKHRLGVFKLKDKTDRNTVQLDIPLILKSMPGARHIWITKVPGVSNKFVIDVHYDEIPKNEDKIQFEKN